MFVRNFTKLFAAYHVLHRLSMPRHPPNALLRLILLNPSVTRENQSSRNYLTPCGIRRTTTGTRKTNHALSLCLFTISHSNSQKRCQNNLFAKDEKSPQRNAIAPPLSLTLRSECYVSPIASPVKGAFKNRIIFFYNKPHRNEAYTNQM